MVPTSGVTAVGVLPTHRRRGVLRSLMARQLEDVAERGEPVAILTASEATIYRRFGYGVACVYRSIEVDRARATFVSGRPDGPAGSRRPTGCSGCCRGTRRSSGRRRGSTPSGGRGRARSAGRRRGGRSCSGRRRRGRAAGRSSSWRSSDADDRPGGYVIYRVTDGPGPDERKLRVRELVAADPAVREQLWRYLFGVDLVTTIDADVGARRSAALAAHRLPGAAGDRGARLPVGPGDGSGGRARRPALRARGRPGPRDRRRRPAGDVGGRYAVAGGPEGATCERTSASADLVMDVAELGSLLLGGASARVLGEAGRIDERSAGALAVADAFFGLDLDPPAAAPRSDPPSHRIGADSVQVDRTRTNRRRIVAEGAGRAVSDRRR